MKIVLALIMLAGNIFHADTPSLYNIRVLYQKAPFDKDSCQKLISLLEPYDETTNPVLCGYKASAMMIMAKHSINPIAKLSHFNKGKVLLQRAIQTNKTNIELRFLRFAAQSNAPSFLKYDSEISADKSYILKSINKLIDHVLKDMIIKHFNSAGILQGE